MRFRKYTGKILLLWFWCKNKTKLRSTLCVLYVLAISIIVYFCTCFLTRAWKLLFISKSLTWKIKIFSNQPHIKLYFSLWAHPNTSSVIIQSMSRKKKTHTNNNKKLSCFHRNWLKMLCLSPECVHALWTHESRSVDALLAYLRVIIVSLIKGWVGGERRDEPPAFCPHQQIAFMRL